MDAHLLSFSFFFSFLTSLHLFRFLLCSFLFSVSSSLPASMEEVRTGCCAEFSGVAVRKRGTVAADWGVRARGGFGKGGTVRWGLIDLQVMKNSGK
jgi:hypothetical protein